LFFAALKLIREYFSITKAVKGWMTKTRETTPKVEILKSAIMIFREFGTFLRTKQRIVGCIQPVYSKV
jgi:hypothetical protein